ncbi:DUF6617 family protein [Flavobacterium sp. FZUC8N2.13]|uniref:DUF6617 family protein n=1 Tax=Flavobacterium zubiriense TaxID=3138075 RepID=A0ABV4TEH3_9FLAO
MLGITESTTESPLEFFNQLLFFDGLKLVLGSFYTENSFTKGYKFINEENREFTFTAWVHKDDISDMIHIENYLARVLKFNTKLAFDSLNKSLVKMEEMEANKFLIHQLNLLYSLIVKYDTDENNTYPEIRTELISIISYINIRYSHYQLTHKAFRKLTNNPDSIFSFFQVKSEITNSFFEKLYDVAISLDLIDDVETSEDLFNEVFTSTKPEPESKIHFIKPNANVAFFLKEIESFFENFNSTTIEKSRSFLNKQGKILTSTDLYTALSRNKDKQNTDLIKIQNEINLLKKQYLK